MEYTPKTYIRPITFSHPIIWFGNNHPKFKDPKEVYTTKKLQADLQLYNYHPNGEIPLEVPSSQHISATTLGQSLNTEYPFISDFNTYISFWYRFGWDPYTYNVDDFGIHARDMVLFIEREADRNLTVRQHSNNTSINKILRTAREIS